MRTEPVTFQGASGAAMAGRLESPDGPPRAYALFAHCFTCGKDSAAAVRVSRALAARDIATLRFDFAGLGGSEGEFCESTFSTNVDDLVAAADFLRGNFSAPAIVVGHSLGGACVLAGAHRMADVRAVATIGAPSELEHVTHHFAAGRAEIEERGEADVMLGGRRLTIRRSLLEDLAAQNLEERIAHLRKALLVLHAPTDEVVGVEHAARIFAAARHPKSFVSLDKADHYLQSPPDADYAAGVIAAWAARYV